MLAQTADQAAGRTQNGSSDDAATALADILLSQDKEGALLRAIEYGALPDQVGLELAEVFGEVVKVSDLDKSVDVVTALSERGMISTLTEQILFLAIIEMATQEEVGPPADDKPVEEVEPVVPVQMPELTGRVAIIKAATELQQEFGTVSAIPADKLGDVRQSVEKLAAEEFASLRQFLGSAILAQAELPTVQRQIDVAASLVVVEIILRSRQAELTAAIFTAYETLNKQGFRLRDRDEAGRPLVTITSTNLVRNRFRAWLDSHESGLGEEQLAAAEKEKAVSTLERFLISAAHESVQEAIQADLANRLRERIIKSGVQALDNINAELVAALPRTKEEARQQIVANPLTQAEIESGGVQPLGCLDAEVSRLGSYLRTLGSKNLAEADSALEEIISGLSLCTMWRKELERLESSDYNPADQQPQFAAAEKRAIFFENERKELDSIRAEIEEEIEKSLASGGGSKAQLRKLNVLRGITARKIEDIDKLITATAMVPVPPAFPSLTIKSNGTPPLPTALPFPPAPTLASAPAKEAGNNG